jgi:hypothetical protein
MQALVSQPLKTIWYCLYESHQFDVEIEAIPLCIRGLVRVGGALVESEQAIDPL